MLEEIRKVWKMLPKETRYIIYSTPIYWITILSADLMIENIDIRILAKAIMIPIYIAFIFAMFLIGIRNIRKRYEKDIETLKEKYK